MNLASRITDGRINAENVLLDMTIREYLNVAKDIIKNNEFQRRRVKNSSSVYALLKKDLRSNCTMPPIVLAIKAEKMEKFISPHNIEEEQIKNLFTAENLIILDGLQRTYTILDLESEMVKENNADALNGVLNNRVRVELYLGVNKIGILYRMLTLNTGQTPMSIRHQIEILYSDYIEKTIDNISLLREIDAKKITRIGEYQFKDVIEGFNSYLDRDELGINRNELLENIQNLEKLALENGTSDLFQDYISTYNAFMTKIDILTNHWKLENGDFDSSIAVFGKDILQVFTKAQVLSGFGAAIGKLKDARVIEGFESVKNDINSIVLFENDKSVESVMSNLLNKLNEIKNRAKKIGVEQRMFFTYFFRELFNSNSDSYLNINKAIDNGYNKYSSLI